MAHYLRRIVGWFWSAIGLWLHIWAWYLWPGTLIKKISRCCGDVYGDRYAYSSTAWNRYKFMTFIIPILSGALFGAGLLVSGMTDPSKVLGFLNIFGLWDPSLILVMGGGLIVSFLGSRWAQGTQRPWFDITFSWPKKQKIDGALVIGSAIFGIGWGLAGICPGPAIAGLGSFIPSIILFFLPMIAGLFLGHWTRNFWESKNVG